MQGLKRYLKYIEIMDIFKMSLSSLLEQFYRYIETFKGKETCHELQYLQPLKYMWETTPAKINVAGKDSVHLTSVMLQHIPSSDRQLLFSLPPIIPSCGDFASGLLQIPKSEQKTWMFIGTDGFQS